MKASLSPKANHNSRASQIQFNASHTAPIAPQQTTSSNLRRSALSSIKSSTFSSSLHKATVSSLGVSSLQQSGSRCRTPSTPISGSTRRVHHLQSIPVRPRLITLDVTGTLLIPTESIGAHYMRAAGKMGIPLKDPAVIQTAFKKAYIETDKEFPHFGAGQLATSRDWWYTCVKKTFYHTGLNLPYRQQDALFEQIYSDFGLASTYKVYADVFPFLSSIALYNQTVSVADRILLGVLSNGDDRYQDHTLPLLNLHPYLDFTLVSYRENLSKPNPLFFDRAIEKANQILSYITPAHETLQPIEHHQVLHIGNSLPLDYNAALSAGVQAALLIRQPDNDAAAATKTTTTFDITSDALHLTTTMPRGKPKYTSSLEDYEAMLESLTLLLNKAQATDTNPFNYDVYRTLLDVRNVYLPELQHAFSHGTESYFTSADQM